MAAVGQEVDTVVLVLGGEPRRRYAHGGVVDDVDVVRPRADRHEGVADVAGGPDVIGRGVLHEDVVGVGADPDRAVHGGVEVQPVEHPEVGVHGQHVTRGRTEGRRLARERDQPAPGTRGARRRDRRLGIGAGAQDDRVAGDRVRDRRGDAVVGAALRAVTARACGGVDVRTRAGERRVVGQRRDGAGARVRAAHAVGVAPGHLDVVRSVRIKAHDAAAGLVDIGVGGPVDRRAPVDDRRVRELPGAVRGLLVPDRRRGVGVVVLGEGRPHADTAERDLEIERAGGDGGEREGRRRRQQAERHRRGESQAPHQPPTATLAAVSCLPSATVDEVVRVQIAAGNVLPVDHYGSRV